MLQCVAMCPPEFTFELPQTSYGVGEFGSQGSLQWVLQGVLQWVLQ